MPFGTNTPAGTQCSTSPNGLYNYTKDGCPPDILQNICRAVRLRKLTVQLGCRLSVDTALVPIVCKNTSLLYLQRIQNSSEARK